MAVVAALRREDPARVLPLALATVCALVSALGGAKSEPDEWLAEWGVITPDDAADREAARSIENLRAIAANLQSRRKTEDD